MTAKQISEKCGGAIIHDNNKDTNGVYVGDFLSRAISRASADCCWITIMNNVNVAGVAVMADVAVIVICDGVVPDERLIEKCKEENIGLVTTDKDVYSVCKTL